MGDVSSLANSQTAINFGLGMASKLCGDYMMKHTIQAYDKITKKIVQVEVNDEGELIGDQNLVINKIKQSAITYQQLNLEYKNSGKKWTDPDFPPNSASIGNAQLDYQPKWKRIPDVIDNAKFLANEISPHDILQGGLGDCYLLSAIAALAQKPERIQRLFPDLQSHHDTGIYMVKLIYGGIMRQVVVDDFIPIDPSGRSAFVKPHDNQFWPLIIEKAWAKLNGNYGAIIGGLPHEVLNSMTTAPTFYYQLNEPKTQADQKQMNHIWDRIMQGTKAEWCFCTGTTADPSINRYGLVEGHAYTMLGGYEISRQGRVQRIVKLRNPWGKKEWSGRCSDGDSQFWGSVSQADRSKLGLQNRDDGIFFMGWLDFLKFYDMLDICKIDEGYGYTFNQLKTDRKNGIFQEINTMKAGKAYVGLHQRDNRGQSEAVKNLGYARSTIVVGRQNGDQYEWVNAIMENSFCDTHLEIDLQPGKTVVYGKFDWINTKQDEGTISLYHENNCTLTPASKSSHPNFLQKVYWNFAENTKDKRVLASPDDWVVVKLLYDKGGFGLIAANSKTVKIGLKGSEEGFNRIGYVLKKPLKGKGRVELTAQPGKPALILARLSRSYKDQRIRFPPEDLSMQII